MNYVTVYIYRVCEWIMRLAYVNLLWISFSILGFIVFSIFPSTIAMFVVVRQWIRGNTDIKIFMTFWNSYKNEWVRGNILGIFLAAIGLTIYFQNWIIVKNADLLLQFSKYSFLFLIIGFIFVLLYIFPTYVHYQISLFQVFKNSLLIMIVNPFYNVVLILSLVLLAYIFKIMIPLGFFFGASATAYIIMWNCYKSFQNVEQKKLTKSLNEGLP